MATMAKIDSSMGAKATPLARIAPGEYGRHAEQHRTPQGDDEQSSREFEHGCVGNEEAHHGARKQIDQRHQAAGQDEIEQQPGPDDGIQSAGLPPPIACAPKIETDDRNRHRGELRIAHDLVDGAIGCGGVRAEAVDEAEQHQFGDRHHHHPDRARDTDAAGCCRAARHPVEAARRNSASGASGPTCDADIGRARIASVRWKSPTPTPEPSRRWRAVRTRRG